jgi:hypothetical protein
MLLFRLLTTGVCVACVVMLASIRPARVEVRAPVELDPARLLAPCLLSSVRGERAPPISVVDVAHGVTLDALAALVHLRPDERVSAINDRSLDRDRPARDSIAALAPHTGEFLDLTVASATTERRVLVLMH